MNNERGLTKEQQTALASALDDAAAATRTSEFVAAARVVARILGLGREVRDDEDADRVIKTGASRLETACRCAPWTGWRTGILA